MDVMLFCRIRQTWGIPPKSFLYLFISKQKMVIYADIVKGGLGYFDKVVEWLICQVCLHIGEIKRRWIQNQEEDIKYGNKQI